MVGIMYDPIRLQVNEGASTTLWETAITRGNLPTGDSGSLLRLARTNAIQTVF